MGNCCLGGQAEHFLTPFIPVLRIVNSKGWLMCHALFSFCNFSQVLSRSVTQSVRGPERLDFQKTASFDFRRRRTFPILLSMLSSPFLHLGQPMCQHASRHKWEIYGISKMSPIWMPEAPKLKCMWPLRMGLPLSLFCDFWRPIGWHGC